MNNDDSRGNQSYQHRKPSPYKNSYSPNSVYYGNSNHNNQQPQQQQRKKHFPGGGGHNKGSSNNNDRLMKQNDTIIRLLKEIRDRLPAPAGAVNNENGEDFNQRSNIHAEGQSEHQDSDAVENDDNEDSFDNTDEDSFEVENERD
jgi:hypothetical protein